ncbi:MAG: InlB B-repeat-containing protein, partial [Clostridia bacterium]|nr:InlB B-repeat-containing protein [Clostridia bacterium]
VFGKWNDGTGDFAAGATYTMPAANVTFTATWVAAHTVTFTTGFQADATTGPASQKYAEGDTVTLPENTFVQKEDYQNYIFTGWKVGTNTNLYQPGATFVMPAQDVTVQAQWTEGKSIAFDLDGGTGNVPATKYYAKGSSVTLPTQQGLSKLGYTLTGWKCNDEDETVYNLGASYTVGNYDATFTAVWKAASGQKHTVTVFKSYIDSQINSVEGTAPSYEAMEAGETFTLPETGLTLAHYRLTKWFVYIYEIDERDGSGYWAQQPGGYAPGATVTMPDCNIQLKAQWQANSVTISFDANGGTGTMTPITKTYGNTLSLPANGFTAPADKTFQGWSDTANGSVLGNGEKLVEPLVKADDTVTLYAIWQSQAQTVTIDGMLGHWTGTAHTLDIVKDGADENVSGYAVLDDKYLLQVYEAGGTFYAASFDYEEYYTVTLSGTSLSLKPYIGAAITLTEKSALTSANRGVFAGKWKKNDSTNQPWVITETAVAYNKSLTAGNSITIGDNIVMWYEVSEQYSVYVLRKSGDNLVGYYDANEKAPTDVTFVAGDYLVLYVDGVPNQIVNSGSAPDANKIKTPEAPEKGKTFDKWVLADNETEFDATATMTA